MMPIEKIPVHEIFTDLLLESRRSDNHRYRDEMARAIADLRGVFRRCGVLNIGISIALAEEVKDQFKTVTEIIVWVKNQWNRL